MEAELCCRSLVEVDLYLVDLVVLVEQREALLGLELLLLLGLHTLVLWNTEKTSSGEWSVEEHKNTSVILTAP